MKKRVMCAVIASAMIAATAMTTAAYADDTTAAVSENEALLTRGVWAAYADKDGDGEYDDLNTYYIFEDEKTGHTSAPKEGIGLPFSVEQSGETALFRFASADDNTNAEITELGGNDFMVTFTYEDAAERTYKFVAIVGADPDTFSGENDAYADEAQALLTRGVWAAYNDKDGDGKYDDLDDYYVFTDETEGHTSGPLMGMGIPFGVEQNGSEALFHFGGTDDNTPAGISVLDNGELLITFSYENGNTQTSRFVKLGAEDPDTFAGESALFGDFVSTDDGLQLYDASYIFDRIYSIPADYCDTVLVINYAMPLLEGFDLEFSFTTSDKGAKTYKLSYDGMIDNDTVAVPVRDLLAAAGINGQNIVSFSLNDKNDRAIVTAGFAGEFGSAVNVILSGSGSVDSADDEQNPATGVSDLFAAGALAMISGAAAIITQKRK